MKITIIGPQGSGKGTQAQLLAKKYNTPNISIGAILRKNIEDGTELGKAAEGLINAGKFAPDELINELVKNRLKEDDCKNGFILDGYPRSLSQGKIMRKMLDIDFLLEVYISDKESIRRISGRRSCVCGEVYHIVYSPPKQEGICDKDGGKLTQRDDDKEEVIKIRLKTYHEVTEPLVEFYEDKHIKINGEQPIEGVFKEILEKLGE
ncbi:nucleoside monophosphate kinase [Candidatus Woesearchaeota archaeon]|nr:nucleoside monophosphate kinase [Candidatus Woesearchaeota archaeon]